MRHNRVYMGGICFVSLQVDSFQDGNIVEAQVTYVVKLSMFVTKEYDFHVVSSQIWFMYDYKVRLMHQKSCS